MKNSLIKFLSNKKGAVAVEFMLLLIVLVIMFAFMFDLVLMRSTVGKLERTSYSLLNVVKESRVYGKVISHKDPFTQSDIDSMQKLATTLMHGDSSSNSKKVEIYLEYLELEDGAGNDRASRKVKNGYPIVKESSNQCKPSIPISNLIPSSPVVESVGNNTKSSNDSSRGLYRVTVCAEVNSLFKSILVSKQNQSSGLLQASSHGPKR